MANHVFISYVRDNVEIVTRLASDLRSKAIDVWLDHDRLTPGERWRQSIREAIRSGVKFLACFSRQYAEREKSYMNEELVIAIDELRQRPADRTWFIPVLLEGGSVPDRSIGAGETLQDLHWLDLSRDWNHAINALVQTIRRDAPSVESTTASPITTTTPVADNGVLVVLTLGAGNIGRNVAHLYGSASSAAVQTWFDFAPTPDLNYSIDAVNGFGVAHMLQPNTTYYFRYVGQDANNRTVRGEVHTFTTLP